MKIVSSPYRMKGVEAQGHRQSCWKVSEREKNLIPQSKVK